MTSIPTLKPYSVAIPSVNNVWTLYHWIIKEIAQFCFFSPTTTTITIIRAILGSIYTIEIKASNILGYGPTAVTTIGKPVVNIGGKISTCSYTSICSDI